VTVSGRFNLVQIDLSDRKATPWLTAYAGYSTANRAPTPAELSCAGPADSCSLANFFVGDPNLKQVVADTVEAGARGSFTPFPGGVFRYSLALFRTNVDDDIALVNSVSRGRAYFANIGQTQRQGIDAGMQLKTDRWLAYLAYAFIDASFQSRFVEAAGNNPAADSNGNITVRPGDRLPGVPANQLKLGAYYVVTDKWTVGATGIATSGTYLFGGEANLTPRLPSYFTLNLSTTYQLTERIQVFAWAQNITNRTYYTYGTFSPTSSVFLAQAPNATDPRSYSPAAPIGGFGGVRVRF